jgi:hypothetical protein
MPCPLVLLVNIDWGPGVTVGYEEGKGKASGLMMSQRKLLLDYVVRAEFGRQF